MLYLIKAMKEIALDNGVSIEDSLQVRLLNLHRSHNFMILIKADIELALLNDEEMKTICCGEHEEQQKVMKKHKLQTADKVLNTFFENL